MAYKVVQAFTDLKDGDKVYRVGDIYEGEDPKRINDLLANDNKGRHTSLKGKPLIALYGKTPEAPETPPETPEDEVKATKKGKK
ncbi:MAG: hypothetical protein L0F89_07855 [Lactococcus raffinolactis]|nr:hypothetical protein [Lactococcus raffinolactis]